MGYIYVNLVIMGKREKKIRALVDTGSSYAVLDSVPALRHSRNFRYFKELRIGQVAQRASGLIDIFLIDEFRRISIGNQKGE